MTVVRTECSDGGFTWLALVAPTDEEVAAVERETGLAGLAPVVAGAAGRGPGLDPDGPALHTVLKALSGVGLDGAEVGVDRVTVVVADGVVVTSQAGEAPDLGRARERLGDGAGVPGPITVLLMAAEAVLASYEPVLDDVDERVDAAEAAVFGEGRDPHAVQTLYALKKTVLGLRRAVSPVADVLEELVAADSVVALPSELRPRARYLADRARHAAAEVAADSELLSDALQAVLARQGNQQNDDMRLISAWAAVAAVPTLLAGVWGMNFRHMPELDWTLGYPLALALIVGASAALAAFFHRRGWI